MELVKAIQKALDGQAVLFAGAGFSTGAVNIDGAKFKSGRQLAKMLSIASSVDEIADLDEAADIYIEKHTKTELINLLKKEYTLKEYKSFHKTICTINWMRIYTTNYDNILETCYAQNKKKLTPVTISDNIEAIDTASALCIHLNGFIDRLNSETIMNEFKLTNTSYLTTSFLNSPWIARFRSDIKFARAIFFVGYSLYDLDIKRILFESDELRDKCFFIVKENPNEALKYRISKFGTITPIGVEGLAKEIGNVEKKYVPIENEEMAYISFEKIEPAPASSRLTQDDAIFKLFLYGDVDRHHLWASLQDSNKYPYFIYRQAIDDFIKSIESGRKNMLIHSELGNGKSLLVEAIALKALERGIQPYILRLNRDNVFEELDSIVKQKVAPLVVIENYYHNFPLLEYIQMNRNDNLILVVTARTAINDVFYDRLDASLGHKDLTEFDLNKLVKSEIEMLIMIMDRYGLWQTMAGSSSDRKRPFIEYDCKGEFQGVLVSVLNSPDIQKRFADIISALTDKKDYYNVIIAVLVLDVLSINPTAESVMELLNSSAVNTRHSAVIL